MYRNLGKRLLDIVVSSSLIVVLAPLFLGLTVAVWLSIGRPVFFTQIRPGLDGRNFRLQKFRSMKSRPSDSKISDSDRLTPFGRRLRSSSLDELPELFNVLKGDMSLVGPRPLLPEYLSLYNQDQRRRHEVRPGITGLAQVNGRNAISWQKRLSMDVQYVNNYSLSLDLQIMAKPVSTVMRRVGVSHPGEATMPEFLGNLDDTSTSPDM